MAYCRFLEERRRGAIKNRWARPFCDECLKLLELYIRRYDENGEYFAGRDLKW